VNEMAVLLINSGPGNTSGMACTRMIILSVLFHCMIFSFVLFVPGYTPDRKIGDAVYEVNLVELPPKTPLKKTVKAATKRRVAKKRHAPAKRITKPKKKEKPVVIAKRSMTQKSHKLKRRKKSSSRLIDQAVAKIEKKVRAEKNHVEQEMARFASRAKDRDVKQVLGRGSENGITIRIYKMEVEDRVKYLIKNVAPGGRLLPGRRKFGDRMGKIRELYRHASGGGKVWKISNPTVTGGAGNEWTSRKNQGSGDQRQTQGNRGPGEGGHR